MGRLVLQQAAYGVPHPDHRMSRPTRDPGQQARPPLAEHVPPGPPRRLPYEVIGPVRYAAWVAQRRVPVVDRHARVTVGHVLKLVAVAIQPAVDTRRLAAPYQGLHRHWGVVAEPAEPFGPKGVQALQRLVQGAGQVGNGGGGCCGVIEGIREIGTAWQVGE